MKKKVNKKNKIINIVLFVLIIISALLLCYSGYEIYKWFMANKHIDEQVEEINEIVEVKEKEDTEKVELLNPNAKKEDPYWDYIKLKLIDVNFEELEKINSDVVGWIQVGGTNVNYPIVQASDNKFYLSHQFNKSYNTAGWVFMDYRNDSNNFNNNTIIYGHGRLNRTMFGSLRNVVKKDWYNNTQNYIVKLSTKTENTLWQVFSTYQIKTTNDYLDIDFNSDEEYLKFLNMLKERSVHDYMTDVSASDKIITLSTCHNDTDKIVLHAKLIKREKKEL